MITVEAEEREMQFRRAGLAAAVAMMAGSVACALPEAQRKAVPVRVEKTANGFRLLRAGKPYPVLGAGGRIYLESLKAAGGNSIRTWGEEEIEDLLDRAHALGLTVTVGIWLGQERQGFSYANDAAVRTELEKTRRMVRRYKDHPAVLMWGLGNEMEGNGTSEKIWRSVNEIARMVKQEDPGHPTMTVIAEIGDPKVKMFNTLCPDVDVLGINSYAGLPSLSTRLRDASFFRPYLITEFGPQGTWEVKKTAWNAPLEATSTEKGQQYADNWSKSIKAQPACLGSYAFLWGHKQEATATWFGMFLSSGEKLGAVDAMTQCWTGKPAANQSPKLARIESDAAGKAVPPLGVHKARVVVTDPESDPLMVRWEIRAESTDRKEGGDRETEPLARPEAFIEAKGMELTFRSPGKEGGYRVFAYVYDGKGGAATANFPFFVRIK
jgi:hypothetical protein